METERTSLAQTADGPSPEAERSSALPVVAEELHPDGAEGMRALLPAVEPERQLDDWGRSERVEGLFDTTVYEFFYRYWFRTEVEGIENVPSSGGALLVSNHAGALPPDAPMIAKAIKEEHPRPRPLHLTVEHFFKGYPGFSMLIPKVGCVAAHPANVQRLLFDEQASPFVARALQALRLRVSHVGDANQPDRGSDDETVLRHAQATNQVIVTHNHDMIVLCADESASVVWLDPRDKDLSRQAMVVLCFTQVPEWQRLLDEADGPICVVARKTRCEALALDVARKRALERGKRVRRTMRKRHARLPDGGLFELRRAALFCGSQVKDHFDAGHGPPDDLGLAQTSVDERHGPARRCRIAGSSAFRRLTQQQAHRLAALSQTKPGFLLFGSALGHLGYLANDENYRPMVLLVLLAVEANDVFAYLAAVLANSHYPARFTADLATPGLRVPLTADPGLFAEVTRIGRRVIWLHTFGERYTDPVDDRPAGAPRAPARGGPGRRSRAIAGRHRRRGLRSGPASRAGRPISRRPPAAPRRPGRRGCRLPVPGRPRPRRAPLRRSGVPPTPRTRLTPGRSGPSPPAPRPRRERPPGAGRRTSRIIAGGAGVPGCPRGPPSSAAPQRGLVSPVAFMKRRTSLHSIGAGVRTGPASRPIQLRSSSAISMSASRQLYVSAPSARSSSISRSLICRSARRTESVCSPSIGGRA